MHLFSRRRASNTETREPSGKHATVEHFTNFVASRRGVEAYVEPATAQTQTTLLLIASDGEWTRRRVPDPEAAWKLAKSLDVPCYDVNFVGYPQRMRDWNARQRSGPASA